MAANSLVLSVDDTNDIEYNLKTALKIYLQSLLVDSAISAVDSSLLIEIAYRNPSIAGNGVFIARNLLNLEIYNEEESGSRVGSYNQRNTVEKSIKVFPVPTKDAVHIIPEGDFSPEGMELRSIKGELVYVGEFKNYFNIEFLKSGIYILKVYSGNNSLHTKIVKLP
ncbi:MAG: T9SS type A sorting domain-containing protein [Bacteroidetes bacterium]|nr:T9SS type A sorting domain-containing protein [Bacteroidota bacterium]